MGQPVMHWQILSKRPADLAKFYGSIFGWNISLPDALGSRSVQTGSTDGIAGGIWQIPSEAHAMTQLFIRVDDVTAYVKRVEAGGGKVLFPPQVIPSGDE
jgi:uncharacterized protein